MVVQAVALEWMLAVSNAAAGLRAIVMVADVYQLLFVLALGAASATRPPLGVKLRMCEASLRMKAEG